MADDDRVLHLPQLIGVYSLVPLLRQIDSCLLKMVPDENFPWEYVKRKQ